MENRSQDWERGKPESSDHIGVRIKPGPFPYLVRVAQFEDGRTDAHWLDV